MTPDAPLYADGLYIQSDTLDVQPRSAQSVAQLRGIIADALEKAGVDTPRKHKTGDSLHANSQRLSAQLSQGEYGEFKAALRTVGLTYEKCIQTKPLPDGRTCVAMLDWKGRKRYGEDDVSLKVCPATRIGAMFVSKRTEIGRVEFRKLIVWA